MLPLAQTQPPQLPPLPEGPALESVRAPIEAGSGYETWQIALAALAVILIALSFIWLYLRSRNKEAAALPPKEAALAELDAASQATDDERFALLCANALRRYLEYRFNLPATAQTSAELVSRLPLQPDDKENLRSFLEACDGVKFAGQALSEEQRIQLMDTAKSLIHAHSEQEETG